MKIKISILFFIVIQVTLGQVFGQNNFNGYSSSPKQTNGKKGTLAIYILKFKQNLHNNPSYYQGKYCDNSNSLIKISINGKVVGFHSSTTLIETDLKNCNNSNFLQLELYYGWHDLQFEDQDCGSVWYKKIQITSPCQVEVIDHPMTNIINQYGNDEDYWRGNNYNGGVYVNPYSNNQYYYPNEQYENNPNSNYNSSSEKDSPQKGKFFKSMIDAVKEGFITNSQDNWWYRNGLDNLQPPQFAPIRGFQTQPYNQPQYVPRDGYQVNPNQQFVPKW